MIVNIDALNVFMAGIVVGLAVGAAFSVLITEVLAPAVRKKFRMRKHGYQPKYGITGTPPQGGSGISKARKKEVNR